LTIDSALAVTAIHRSSIVKVEQNDRLSPRIEGLVKDGAYRLD